MDEPLSNLDAKLRVQMRREIIRLQRVLGTTTIYVTHDQVEAMTMGDRIMVLRFGRIQQIGPPEQLYNNPANMFVGGFIGSPAMNVSPGRLEGSTDGLMLVTRSGKLPLPPQTIARLRADGIAAVGPREVMWGIRAEDIRLGPVPAAGGDGLDMRATVDLVEGLGSDAYVSLALSGDNIVARTPADTRPAENETVGVQINPNKLHLFDGRRKKLSCHSERVNSSTLVAARRQRRISCKGFSSLASDERFFAFSRRNGRFGVEPLRMTFAQ